MKVSAQYAESHIVALLHAADGGEEIDIARPHQPTYRLTPVTPAPATPSRSELWGAWKGVLSELSQHDWDTLHQQLIDEFPNVR